MLSPEQLPRVHGYCALYFTIQLSTKQTFQLKINSPWLASERHHRMLPGTLSLFLVKTEQISGLQAVEHVPRVHGMYLCKGKKKKNNPEVMSHKRL